MGELQQSSSVNEETSSEDRSNEASFAVPPPPDRKRKSDAISAVVPSSELERSSDIPQDRSDENAMDIDDDSSNDTQHDIARDRLDRIATREEEEYVMGQILHNIEASEIQERSSRIANQFVHGDMVRDATIVAPGSDRHKDTDTATMRPWSIPSNIDPQSPVHPWRKNHPRKRTGRISKIREGDMGEEMILRTEFQCSLPRWISSELGFYNDGPLVLLFTRLQFIQNVILKAEEQIHRLGPVHKGWKATLSDHNPKDPRSYLLEFTGSIEALDILLELTETFVSCQIDRINLDLLLEDGASLVVNVKCSLHPCSKTAENALGVSFSSVNNSKEGVLIKWVMRNGILAKTYPKVFEKGCTLLAVDNKKVSNLSDVDEHLMQFKHQFPKPRTPIPVELSICLSKFTNLRNSPNISSWNIRRRDGIPYSMEDYERFQLDRCIEWLQKQSTKQSTPAVDGDEDYQDEEDESSTGDEDSHLSPTISRKGTYQKTKTVLSNSDSSLDYAFNQEDEESDEDSDEEKTKPKSQRPGLSTSDLDPRVQTQSGYAIFKSFEDKMKPLVRLDYKDTKINIKSICSSMWKKHKELFGEDERCDDKCKCLLWLPDMTADVITDHIERQREKNLPVETEEHLENRTRGITKRFAPKFLSLLQEQYPKETEAQLICRLVEMWEIHQRHRMYGIKCREDCNCRVEWDTIFGKGDKAAAKDFVSTMKRSSLHSRSSASSDNSSIVPKKKRAHSPNSNMSRKIPRLSSLISSMQSREAILEVHCKSSIPLGGYFRTRRNECQVFSIYPKGQMAKEPRIRNGCTVRSVKTGGVRITISSHVELQRHYEAASKNGAMISLLFGNQGVTSTISDHQRMNNICWNDSGHWVGTHNLDENDGWAGGATIGPKPKKSPKKSTERNGSLSTRSPSGSPAHDMNVNNVANDQQKEIANTTRSPESIDNGSIEEWTTIVNTEKPYDKSRQPSKSLLIEKSSFPPPAEEEKKDEKGLSKLLNLSARRSRRERTHSKKIKISIQDNEEIFFCKDDAPNMRRILQIKNGANQKDGLQLLDPKQDLINAFQKKSCNDVLQILDSQEFLSAVSQGVFDFHSVLRRQYSFIGTELDKVSASESSSAISEMDLRAKQRILSIYIKCIHLIEKTLTLKKWYELTIELKYIDFQHKSSIIDEIGGNVAVKLDDGNMKENFGNLPSKIFSEHISYVDNNLKYSTPNNKSFSFEKRSFVIDMKKVSNTFLPDRILGAFKIELNDIEDNCPSDETPTEFTASLSKSDNHELMSGHITLKVCKKSADKNYMMNKKQEIINKLKQQMEFIDRFNNDPKKPPGAKLTANMLCRGGNSLLHAAVILMDDTDLVRSMLKLGANPGSNFHTGVGTPLSLAQRHLHVALDKERHMRDKNIDAGQQVLRCNQARSLVEMLQQNVIGFPSASAAAATATASTTRAYPLRERNNEPQSSDVNQLASTNDTPNPQTSGDMLSASKSQSKKSTEETPSLQRGWAAFEPNFMSFNFCRFGPECKYYKTGSCRYWHHAVAPLPNEKQAAPRPPIPKDDSEVPNISRNHVEFTKQFAPNGTSWWTAAAAWFKTKEMIYVQKVLNSDFGRVGENGVAWFPSEYEAFYNLRHTLYILERQNQQKDQNGNNRGNSNRNRSYHPNHDHQDRQNLSRYRSSSY